MMISLEDIWEHEGFQDILDGMRRDSWPEWVRRLLLER